MASVLETTATLTPTAPSYGEVTRDKAIHWMLCDRDNASSVLNVIESARSNARLVRTARHARVWEAVNESWMVLRDALASPSASATCRSPDAHPQPLGPCARRLRGHDAAERHLQLRAHRHLHRARRQHRPPPRRQVLRAAALRAGHGSSLDNVQWESILRSVSAEGAYRMTHGGDVRPRLIASFLILDRRMPRSLAFSVSKLQDNFGYLAESYGARLPSHDRALALMEGCLGTGIDAIFEGGLHEFIQDFLRAVAALGTQVEIDYRFTA
jgi:uncharacterized alpha-E superfamily protein